MPLCVLEEMRSTSKLVQERRKIASQIAKRTAMKGGVRVPLYATVRAIHHQLCSQYGYKVSAKTVRRDLKRSMKNLVRPKAPTRNAEQVQKKLRFARRELRRKDLKSTVFSDECWVTCGESASSRTMWVQSRATLLPRETRPRWNQPASLLVWAAVGTGFKSKLVIFPKKNPRTDEAFRLNSEQYIRRCLSITIPHLPRGARWQQDGARSHTSRETTDYLRRRNVTMVDAWPAACPDFNVIEYVWPLLKRRISELTPMNEEQLRSAATRAWDSITPGEINAYVAHYAKALRKCLAASRH